ncbi:MFS transporter [Luteococcus peritonei]|uniref:MFS transporter n=1 Tax=Luteococcus peritonei TaxID=88874 RepID=A0ABW4RSU0_9ACTN
MATGWAWRIPFLVSAVLFGLALWIRKHLEETPAYAAAVEARAANERANRVPLAEVLRHSPRQLLAGFLSVTGHNVVNYVLSAFALGYLTKTVGMPLMKALTAVLIASFVAAVVPPLGGLVVDRIGVRRVVAFGGLAGAVLAYPLFWSLASGSMLLATLGMCLAGLLAMGATSPGTSTFVANLFPTRYRFTGVAAARELNGALVAGPTPLIATALIQKAHGGIGPVSAFVALAALCTFASIFVAGHSGQEAPSEDVEANRAVEAETRG